MSTPTFATLSDSVTAALHAAPTLINQPSVAVGVAQSGTTPDETAALAQAAGQSTNVNAFADAMTAVKHHSGLFGSIMDKIGGAIHVVEHNPVTGDVGSFALQALSKPLQTVQHEYRYLHAVYVKHGLWAGLAETVPVLAGAAVGGMLGGTYGAALGAELVGGVEGGASKLFGGKTSLWNETGDGGSMSQNISFGRDVASLVTHLPVGVKPNSESYSLISGLIDGVADWTADPVAAVGSVGKHMRELTYALKSPRIEDMLARGEEAAPNALGNFSARNVPGQRTRNATRDYLTNVAQRTIPHASPVWRAIDDMAKEKSADALLSRYRGISADMAADLAKAKTHEQVLQTWQTYAAADDHFSTAMMPTATITSLGAAKARAALINTWRRNQADVSFGTKNGVPDIAFPQTVNKAGAQVPDVSAAWRDRLTAYRAYVVNDKDAIDATHVDPAHPNFLKVIRDQALITQNRKVAGKIMDYAGNLDPAGRLAVYRQVVKNNVLAMIPESSSLQQDILAEIDKGLTWGVDGTRAGEYGRDIHGDRIDETDTHAGKVRAAVWSTQLGKVRIPSYMSLVDASRAAGQYAKYFGAADSLMYRFVVAGFFKPMALLTPAFALRVSLSEGLLNAFRDGPRQYVAGQAAQRAGTLRAKLGEEDYGIYNAVGKAVQNAGQWLGIPHGSLTQADLQLIGHHVMMTKADLYDKIARGLAPKDAFGSPTLMETIARLGAENGQRMVPEAISSHEGGNLQHERDLPAGLHTGLLKFAADKPAIRARFGDDWGAVSPGVGNHDDIWAGALNHRARAPEAKSAAEAILRNFKPGRDFDQAEQAAINEHAQWLMSPQAKQLVGRQTKAMLLAKNGTMDLATRQVKDLIAKTFSASTHEPHVPLLRKVADGDKFTVHDVKHIADDDRPLQLPYAETVENHTSRWDRLVNVGFDKLVSPIIDNISRKGIYAVKVDKQYRALKEFSDSSGLMVPDAELWAKAKIRAIEDMLPDIHNVYLRSQFSDLARNIMPFYFAQEQAVKRWGRATVNNVATARRIQMLHHAGRATGVVQTDPTTGEESFVYPIDGLANHVMKALAPLGVNGTGAIPITFRGSMQSLNSVVPGDETFSLRPTGPVVAIPALALQKILPDSQPAVQELLQQGANQGFWEQVVPNSFLRNLIKANYGDSGTSFHNAMFDAARAMVYHGLLPTDETQMSAPARQATISQLKNWTRIALMLNAVVSATGLAATRVQAGDAKIRDEFRQQMQQSGDIRKAMSDFMAKHPNATPYTVFNTDSPLGTSGMPSGDHALQFFNANAGLFAKYPFAASWLFPQVKGDKFSQAAYNEQMAFGLREHKSADQFLKDLYSASADNEFFDNYNKYQAAVTAAGNDKYQLQNLSQSWHTWVSDFGRLHPIWYADFNDPNRLPNARQAADQLGVVLGFLPGHDGEVKQRVDSPQAQPMKLLYQNYMRFQQEATAIKASGRVGITALRQGWKDWLDSVATAHPELQPVISRVFKPIAQDAGDN